MYIRFMDNTGAGAAKFVEGYFDDDTELAAYDFSTCCVGSRFYDTASAKWWVLSKSNGAVTDLRDLSGVAHS